MSMLTIHSRILKISLFLVLIFVAGSCAGLFKVARMDRPKRLNEAAEMKVAGRQSFFGNKMNFGGYKITDVHRGWVKRTKLGILGYTKEKAQQNYEFTLTSPENIKWDVQCLNGMKETDMGKFFPDIAGGITLQLMYENSLGAILTPEGGQKKWTLAVDTKSSSEKAIRKLIEDGEIESLAITRGMVTDGTTKIMIEPVKKYEGSRFPVIEPTGYLFIMDNKVVGGVEVFNKGTVWILDTVQQPARNAIAATATALMLYKNLAE